MNIKISSSQQKCPPLTWQSLFNANRDTVTDRNHIRPGRTLRMPYGTYYLVQKDDTLGDIASNFINLQTGKRSDYEKLAEVNGIKDPDFISPGQKIYFPGNFVYVISRGEYLDSIASKYKKC
jgi:nucleoid-associated protein YgaU